MSSWIDRLLFFALFALAASLCGCASEQRPPGATEQLPTMPVESAFLS
jgi:hypothetical protein